MMNTKNINRNMQFQKDYCKEIMELMDTCEDKGLTGDLTADDMNHLREHCENIMRASDTAMKLATLLQEVLDKEKAATKKTEPTKKAEPPKEEPKVEEPEDTGFDFDD